jgi:hypothetical protein
MGQTYAEQSKYSAVQPTQYVRMALFRPLGKSVLGFFGRNLGEAPVIDKPLLDGRAAAGGQ